MQFSTLLTVAIAASSAAAAVVTGALVEVCLEADFITLRFLSRMYNALHVLVLVHCLFGRDPRLVE
jgi:hypothetical protein